MFNKLKTKYPITLHIKHNRKFKSLFFDYFSINDISNTLDQNNIFIFVSPISELNDNNISDDYKRQVEEFIKLFPIKDIKTIDNILLPRGDKENYPGNNRVCDTSDIEKYVKTILYTDTIDDLKIQINTINISKNIFVLDGSAFLVNSLFAFHSNIIVLGDIVVVQSNNYCKMAYILELIKKNNNVIFIPYIHGNFHNSIFYYDDIKIYIT